MRMRIAAAAGLVIGSAAWAFAQREEPPTLRRIPSPARVPVEAEGVPPPPSASPAIPTDHVPTTPTDADADKVAERILTKAKAELERLGREKKAAEQEMAQVKARIQAAEAGMARWVSLARAVSGVLRESRRGTTAALPDEALPVGETSLIELPVTRLPERRIEDLPAPAPVGELPPQVVEDLPAPAPVEERPAASEPLDLPRAPAATP